jgi:hypothetical protein
VPSFSFLAPQQLSKETWLLKFKVQSYATYIQKCKDDKDQPFAMVSLIMYESNTIFFLPLTLSMRKSSPSSLFSDQILWPKNVFFYRFPPPHRLFLAIYMQEQGNQPATKEDLWTAAEFRFAHSGLRHHWWPNESKRKSKSEVEAEEPATKRSKSNTGDK